MESGSDMEFNMPGKLIQGNCAFSLDVIGAA